MWYGCRSVKTEVELALEVFFWGLEVFSRRDCGWILAGYRRCEGERRVERVLERLRRERLLAQTGRGRRARFTITDAGRQRVHIERPTDSWQRVWDGRWRVFTFDLPARQRKQRMILWRALRDARMGLLQHSVWIWPHEVESILEKVIQSHGIPECFCGFEVGRLFLCDDAEVVATAWDFSAIDRAHEVYLKHPVANVPSLNRADSLQELARVARVERDAYQDAFCGDPLLPRALWPKSYRGARVEERHQQFLARLSRRLRELVTA